MVDERKDNLSDAMAVALSPDGKVLAAGGRDKFVHLWEVSTGRKVGRLEAPGPYVFLAFSPDGRNVATGSFLQNTVCVWETASWGERRRFQGHRGNISAGAFSRDGRFLATGSTDTTILVWDLFDAARGGDEQTQALGAKDVETWWATLADPDAGKALPAIARLTRATEQTVPFLRDHLHPVVATDQERSAPLLADLDSELFATREKATRELESLGESALPALRKVLAQSSSAEVRRRVEQLLAKLEGANRLRDVRAVEALEHIGTSDAREVLQKLAEGTAEARLTREAKAALERLAKR